MNNLVARLLIAWLGGAKSPPTSIVAGDAKSQRQELENRLETRRFLTKSLFWMLLCTVIVCFTLIILDDFHVNGFKLGDSSIKAMAEAIFYQLILLGFIVRGAWRA